MMEFDVVVVGSGSGALMAAMRARAHGLSVIVLEKEHYYGGTSATSAGFMWIPNHGFPDDEGDSPEKAMTYLTTVGRDARLERIQAYVDNGPEMLRFLQQCGVQLAPVVGYPDYFPNAAGAHPGRGVVPGPVDGKTLGKHFATLRPQTVKFKLFTRYSVTVAEGGKIGMRASGWPLVFARILWNYWSDMGWRHKTSRDRRLTLGNALIGGMRRKLDEQEVEVRLGADLTGLAVADGRVIGVDVNDNGQRRRILARRAVILGAGGFEQNQAMREKYFEIPGDARVSATPRGANTGMATLAAMELGADTELMDQAWWNPTLVMPAQGPLAVEITDPVTYDFSRPHSLCVNRLGHRFVNEGCPYDEFGHAMIADHRKTGANAPCWIIFDVQYRAKFALGRLWPSIVLPDRKVPDNWWDNYFYRADSLNELARRIDIDPETLGATVARMNGFANTGVDLDFQRGGNAYDLFSGDPNLKPNPSLGTIEKGPFYAARIELGDIGTKGGLKADEYGRVLDTKGDPMDGLYAVGNAAGSVFGNVYPGAGATVGPSMVYGFIAANDIAHRTNRTGEASAIKEDHCGA